MTYFGNQSMRFLNARWVLPSNLDGHIIIFGQTRSGKSQTLKGIGERLFLRHRIKVLDLYAGGADEGAYYTLKSNHSFWEKRQFKYKNYPLLRAQEFPTTCLIPICKDIPKDLPDFFKPFTIPINTLTENDIKCFLGSDLTKNESALWHIVSERVNKNTTFPDLMEYILDAQKAKKKTPGISGKGVSSIYNLFRSLEKHHMFSSYYCPTALHLRAEMMDKTVITSLIIKHFPEEYWGFLVNYFIKNVYRMCTNHLIKSEVAILMREIGDFLEDTSDSAPSMAVKKSICHILRKGIKTGLHFVCDNQTAVNIDVVKTQFETKICHYVDNIIDLQEALGSLGALLLTRPDYNEIRYFGPGKCFVLTKRGLFKPQIFPPLSRMTSTKAEDFFNLWKTEKGINRFYNISDRIKAVDDEYLLGYKKWKDIEKKKIEAKREKEQKEKAILEEEQEKREQQKVLKAEIIREERLQKSREREVEKERIKLERQRLVIAKRQEIELEKMKIKGKEKLEKEIAKKREQIKLEKEKAKKEAELADKTQEISEKTQLNDEIIESCDKLSDELKNASETTETINIIAEKPIIKDEESIVYDNIIEKTIEQEKHSIKPLKQAVQPNKELKEEDIIDIDSFI